MEDDNRDMPDCWLPGRVDYRPVPGWPRYRVGCDESVWVRERRRPLAPAPPRVHRQMHKGHLTPEMVADVRRLYASGAKIARLMRRFEVSREVIWRTVTGRTYSLLPMPAARDDEPRWRRIRSSAKSGVRIVRLRDDAGREHVRSVALLRRAAFGDRPDLWAGRLGPHDTRPPAREPIPDVPPSQICEAMVPELPRTVEPPTSVPIALADVGDEPDDDRGPARGSAHGRAVLTEDLVAEARKLRREGWTFPELVERYGVSRMTIWYAVTGRTWIHVPMEP